MVKHIILWQLKDEYSAAEKADIKAGIKAGLEGLAGQIPGLLEIHVNINGLPSSNADLMLDTTFESAEALKGYSKHPAHVAVADSFPECQNLPSVGEVASRSDDGEVSTLLY